MHTSRQDVPGTWALMTAVAVATIITALLIVII